MTLWVVGMIRGEKREGEPAPWSIEGVYDTEEQAVAACFDDLCFVGEVELNTSLSEKQWPVAWYPRLQDKPEAVR